MNKCENRKQKMVFISYFKRSVKICGGERIVSIMSMYYKEDYFNSDVLRY